MNALLAAWTVTAPLLLLVIPGLLSLHWRTQGLIERVAQVLLWSVSTTILWLYVGTLLHIPITILGFMLLVVSMGYLVWQRQQFTRFTVIQYSLLTAVMILLAYGALSAPYLLRQDGLPTGDIQKSIYWAQYIIDTNALPPYSVSEAQLNRDPVDFYTPGLHVLTALLLAVTPAPLVAVGLLSLVLVVATAVVATALAVTVLPAWPRLPVVAMTIVLLLSQLRFLRYVREPGYHFQNILGELLLFGTLYVGCTLLKKWSWQQASLGITLFLALILSHQFSTFLLVLILLPVLFIWLLKMSSGGRLRAWLNPTSVVTLGSGVLLLLGGGWWLGLLTKLPHLFTTTPHLLSFVPRLTTYPDLMGVMAFFLGLSGLVGLTITAARRRAWVTFAFCLAATVLLLLSQGPRMGIDIPPVRALFYIAVPFSITGAFVLLRLWYAAYKNARQQLSARVAIVGLLLILMTTTLTRAYTLTNQLRTNSTLTAEYEALITSLKSDPQAGGIVIDDYNRRASTWLLLAGKPMYARLGSELAVQTAEAEQSPLRERLYHKQLDFEKMYLLGSQPAVVSLFEKYGIRWIVGVAGSSSTTFDNNAALTPRWRSGDLTIYEYTAPISGSIATDLDQWLLRPSTLANDIGDNEDTFEHLQAAVPAARLSAPTEFANTTFRTTTAPVIPLRFNVGDYVRPLWSQENREQPDRAVDVVVILTTPVNGLILQTARGREHALTGSRNIVRLTAEEATYDEDGFVTFQLLNEAQLPVSLDVIALGLARVP
ncbi:MAG: hypothetical protein WD972_03225 [Candidatus Andersenbacteria bacterium]